MIGWLDNTLESNPYKWSVVFTHYPVYACSQGRSVKKEYKNSLKPILEKHGVDIVLQGHGHTYCRGQNLSEVEVNTKNKPMYVVSVSGTKMYGLSANFWADRFASNTPLCQHIAFDGDTMFYKSFTIDGGLYNAF